MRFSTFWGVMLVMAPFYIKIQKVIDIRTIQNLFCYFAIMLSVFVYGFKPKWSENKRIYQILLYFVLFAFFMQFDLLNSFSLFQWLGVTLGIVLFHQMSSSFRFEDSSVIIKALILAGSLQSFWLILNKFGVDPYYTLISTFDESFKKVAVNGDTWINTKQNKIVGSLGHPMLSGSMIGILMPLICTKRHLWVFPLWVIGIYYSGSAMAATTAIVGTMFVLLIHFKVSKRFMGIFMGVLGTLFYFLMTNSSYFSDSNRIANWKRILKLNGGAQILTGGGHGFLETFYEDRSVVQYLFRPAHNEFLDIYVAYGIFGVLASIILVIYLFNKLKKYPMKGEIVLLLGVFVAFMFNSLGSFPLHISPTALIFITISSLIFVYRGESNGSIIFKSR